MTIRTAMSGPLGDDWLRWDPAEIHRYPETGPTEPLEAAAEPAHELGRTRVGDPSEDRERHPAVELSRFLLAGFATGLAAGLVLLLAVLALA